MPTIPVIPGVSIATMGILNKPIKDIICAILFGGILNMLKGNLLCVKLDIATLIGLPNLQADLKSELANLQKELNGALKSLGVGEMLGRINKGIAELQSLLALNGLCKIPLKAPMIPDILKQSSDLAFAQMNSILQDLGKLAKPELCLGAGGGLNLGSYNPKSILKKIQGHLRAIGRIPDDQIDILIKRLRGVQAGLRASVNRQLFPDFRHKASLAKSGQKVSANKEAAAAARATKQLNTANNAASDIISPPDNDTIELRIIQQQQLDAIIASTEANQPDEEILLASAAEQQQLYDNIRGSDLINRMAWQLIANIPDWDGATHEEIIEAIIATYPPPDSPNLKDAMNLAHELVSLVDNTASYPADVNGIRHENMWASVLGPQMYSLAVQALTPEDPLFVQQDPVYDYCGKLVGQTSTVITGDPAFAGGDPTIGAELNPPITNFNFIWIEARNCWAVSGVQSEQTILVDGNYKRGMMLNANPTIKILRGYNHILGIPSYDGAALAPEFYICKVGTDLRPEIVAGKVVPFNLGLARLETGELLVDANGTIGTDIANGLDGITRRQDNPFGTTMYFAAGHSVYTGDTAPFAPDPDVWWYNSSSDNQSHYKWVFDEDTQTGEWVLLTSEEMDDNFVGSSTTFNAPNVNYLAYSNISGTVFGLFHLV